MFLAATFNDIYIKSQIPVCIKQGTSGAPATFRPLDFPGEVKVMKLQWTGVDIFQNNLCNKLQNDKKSSAEPRLMCTWDYQPEIETQIEGLEETEV